MVIVGNHLSLFHLKVVVEVVVEVVEVVVEVVEVAFVLCRTWLFYPSFLEVGAGGRGGGVARHPKFSFPSLEGGGEGGGGGDLGSLSAMGLSS